MTLAGGYVKVFESLLDSTVWETPQPTRLVWITMLVMADRDGYVGASIPGLAKRAGVERAECERALALFLAPDPDSRTKEHEGRRIVEADGGWTLLNYEKYRERASFDEKRAKDAERQRRKYERDKQKKEASEPHEDQPNLTDLTREAHGPHETSPGLTDSRLSSPISYAAPSPEGEEAETALARGGLLRLDPLAAVWNGEGLIRMGQQDKLRLERVAPQLGELALARGVATMDLWRSTVERFKADPDLKRKRMATLAVLCSQLEQWVDDAPAKPATPPAPVPLSNVPIQIPEDYARAHAARRNGA